MTELIYFLCFLVILGIPTGIYIKKYVTKHKDDKLIEELKVIHYQLLLTSERFKNCHNDFIQELHEVMEEDEDYKKDFRLTLLITCLSAIDIEPDLDDYTNCLEQECERARIFVQKAMDKYDDGTSFWEQLDEHADKEYRSEVYYMFWYEHFLLAQGLMLDAWRKDKKNDNSYLYPNKV